MARLQREQEKRERAKQKAKIAEWRRAREEESERFAAQQLAVDAEQARHDRKQRRQQLAQREAVEAYRLQRTAEEAQRQQAAQGASAARRCISQEDRRRLAERNMEGLRKKLQEASIRAREAQHAEQLVAAAAAARKSAYDHVGSKLWEETKSWKQRRRQVNEASTEETPKSPKLTRRPPSTSGTPRAASAGPQFRVCADPLRQAREDGRGWLADGYVPYPGRHCRATAMAGASDPATATSDMIQALTQLSNETDLKKLRRFTGGSAGPDAPGLPPRCRKAAEEPPSLQEVYAECLDLVSRGRG
eukprot:gnl/TRDRNA2_/TRDRNA2_167954_c3_seq4.p1 gnl/TRDRNA2_/TRDRNA2_167954_c3~~gnl/TRDRNA2_/TRDRNA2_167954_c3_seq4.p1  ORF type:complete len:352 (+),score=77.38 gnl/TRDRNA2_/TRDRNA2_167954_c3_seq4:146-1057(+)